MSVEFGSITNLLLLAAVGFVAGTVAAVSGFGGAAILTPALVAFFGMRDAVPILTVAQLIGNGSRVWFNRRELDWAVVRWFALGAIPLALLGGTLFARAPLSALTRLLGAFLIALVIWHRTGRTLPRVRSVRSFAAIGAISSFISALLGTVGPLTAPLFLSYGLVKGAYIGTEALATVIVHLTKLVAYGQASLLGSRTLAVGLALGPTLVAGSWVGKQLVDRLPERAFVLLIDGVLLVAGLLFVWRG